MRNPRIMIAVIAVAATAAVGGITFTAAAGSSTPNNSAMTSPIMPDSPTAGVNPPDLVTVHTATATVQGTSETILVDAKGLPLYIYKPDTTTTSRVTGQLAALWPPVVATAPTASGADGTLTSVTTINGNQVAYNGHFLYTFVEDNPGQVSGQGVQNFFVATPGLSAEATTVSKAPPAGTSDTYGY